MCHVDHCASRGVGLVAHVDVAIQEYALPGNEHVVKDNDRVQLLKARAEWMIILAATIVNRLVDDELEA
jgi:hypothetical protein